ncbi:MAG: hypothetical protein ACD_28C00004G0016 [uncultured bacterium]|nr:MAG: hypothetical protein ACD_28C00004G0016 [uncultured bacterium]
MPNPSLKKHSLDEPESSHVKKWKEWMESEIAFRKLQIKNRPFRDAQELSEKIGMELGFLKNKGMKMIIPFGKPPFWDYLNRDSLKTGAPVVIETNLQSFQRIGKIARSAEAWGQKNELLQPEHEKALHAFIRTMERMKENDLVDCPEGLFPFQDLCVALLYQTRPQKERQNSDFLVDHYGAFYATGKLNSQQTQQIRMITTRLMIHLADSANPEDDLDFFHSLNDLMGYMGWLQSETEYGLTEIKKDLNAEGMYSRTHSKREWDYGNEKEHASTNATIHTNMAWMAWQLWEGAFKAAGLKGNPRKNADRMKATQQLKTQLPTLRAVTDPQAAINALQWMEELAEEWLEEKMNEISQHIQQQTKKVLNGKEKRETPSVELTSKIILKWAGKKFKNYPYEEKRKEIEALKITCRENAKTVLIPSRISLRDREKKALVEFEELILSPRAISPDSTPAPNTNLECEGKFRLNLDGIRYEIRSIMNAEGEILVDTGKEILTKNQFKYEAAAVYIELKRLMLAGLNEMLVEKKSPEENHPEKKDAEEKRETPDTEKEDKKTPLLFKLRLLQPPKESLVKPIPFEETTEEEDSIPKNEMDKKMGIPRVAYEVLHLIQPHNESWSREEEEFIKTLELYEMKTIGEGKKALIYPERIPNTRETLLALKQEKRSKKSVFLRGTRPFLRRPHLIIKNTPPSEMKEKRTIDAKTEKPSEKNQQLLGLMQEAFKIRLKRSSHLKRWGEVDPEKIDHIRIHLPEKEIEIDIENLVKYLQGNINVENELGTFAEEIDWKNTALVEQPDGTIKVRLKLKMNHLPLILSPGFFMSIETCEEKLKKRAATLKNQVSPDDSTQ